MKIAIGSDHAGFLLKKDLIDHLVGLDYKVEDLGTHSIDPIDYPEICASVARRVRGGEVDFGIVLGGSGQGEQIAANKIHGVRAALCPDEFTARLARAHNNANVISMGARVVAPAYAVAILDVFLTTPFEGGRHQSRIDQVAELEHEEALFEAVAHGK
ncbi:MULTISPECIES: ribose 5-phosphate isomerase B [Acidithrix]|uniref:Ribose-5-phosphate isomerase B n=1 Tax=Acidithrix ferrooxidans TaxID=1280514 RepID=A0A0D8HM46_9ACTN|nr:MULTISPECIES: ribose 5-phosphate isomerase B [Acidithrix]KJF19085.1 ribose-5-phosphate isomerase B [Acidithrix ferrooxidans]